MVQGLLRWSKPEVTHRPPLWFPWWEGVQGSAQRRVYPNQWMASKILEKQRLSHVLFGVPLATAFFWPHLSILVAIISHHAIFFAIPSSSFQRQLFTSHCPNWVPCFMLFFVVSSNGCKSSQPSNGPSHVLTSLSDRSAWQTQSWQRSLAQVNSRSTLQVNSGRLVCNYWPTPESALRNLRSWITSPL